MKVEGKIFVNEENAEERGMNCVLFRRPSWDDFEERLCGPYFIDFSSGLSERLWHDRVFMSSKGAVFHR